MHAGTSPRHISSAAWTSEFGRLMQVHMAHEGMQTATNAVPLLPSGT